MQEIPFEWCNGDIDMFNESNIAKIILDTEYNFNNLIRSYNFSNETMKRLIDMPAISMCLQFVIITQYCGKKLNACKYFKQGDFVLLEPFKQIFNESQLKLKLDQNGYKYNAENKAKFIAEKLCQNIEGVLREVSDV